MHTVGFIGIGNMGGALAQAVCTARCADTVYISDFSTEKVKHFTETFDCIAADNCRLVQQCDYVFLGVKPQVLPQVLQEIKEAISLNPHVVLITMAAGIPISKIQETLQKDVAVIRIMPNTPISVKEGVIVYSTNNTVLSEQEAFFKRMLSSTGLLDKIPEELMDAACAVSGCGPAFVYMFIDALSKGGAACGLDADKALQYAAQTVKGAAEMLMQSNVEPQTLIDAVCSPAGSTIEGVHVLQNEGLYPMMEQTVKAAFDRAKELGKLS